MPRSFEHGDGDYRPRIPQYPEIQDILGTAVNAVLVGNADPKAALDQAQEAAAEAVLSGFPPKEMVEGKHFRSHAGREGSDRIVSAEPRAAPRTVDAR